MTPRVYFAGVNQTHFCEQFKGHHVLESFADVRPLLDRYRPTFASMVLDSGAFTEMTTGKAVDLGEYIEFCQEHGAAYEWIASLDAIKGGAEKSVANWEAMKARGVDAMPTFHQGEPWSLLEDYCKATDRLGLGFQRPIKDARPWLEDCFARIPDRVRVHGWAMTNYTDFPFASVDSTTWLWELRALLGVEGQGADAIQCLTVGELIEIVQRKYLRLPKRQAWQGRKRVEQLSLLGGE